MNEPEILSGGGQTVTERNDGAFAPGGVALTSEEATRRGALGLAKQHYRKEAALMKRAQRLADATQAVMPPLATDEANEARRLLIEEFSRLATAERGGAAVSALNDLAKRIGDSFQELTKLSPGMRCPRCQGIVGKEGVKVSLDPGGALWVNAQILELRGTNPAKVALLRELAAAWEEDHDPPEPRTPADIQKVSSVLGIGGP